MQISKFYFLFLSVSLFAATPSYLPIVEKASRETGVPVHIIMGVILSESSGDPGCVSPYRLDGHRDEGIMQLNSKYLDYFSWKFNRGVKVHPFSPSSSIPVGARILAFNFRYYENWVEALAAYRQGIGGVNKNSVTHASFCYIDNVFRYGMKYKKEGE
jgi:soluble lytic murein transglycosylase-like protein